jgi:hypothetical protein
VIGLLFSTLPHPIVDASMDNQFAGLLTGMRLQIFELAAAWQCRSRVVEIFGGKKGKSEAFICSNTQPPALLHINSESRGAILKKCKPWHPQLKETAAHAHYVLHVKYMGVEKLSCLQNVYVNLEHVTLLIENWIWNLGPLEFYNLRSLCIDVKGGVRHPTSSSSCIELRNSDHFICMILPIRR